MRAARTAPHGPVYRPPCPRTAQAYDAKYMDVELRPWDPLLAAKVRGRAGQACGAVFCRGWALPALSPALSP